jgi:hypothetical protein
MDTSRKLSINAGVLFILGTIAGLLSVVPVIEQPDYLSEVSANQNQVLSGAFFQFLMIPTYLGFTLSLYPILRKYHKGFALGFVGFRIVAVTFHLIAVISLLLFLDLSQEFIQACAPDASHYQTVGGLLRAGRDLVNHVGMILALSFGDLMLYSVLYHRNLVPRWLSGWGLAGTALAIFASLLFLFRLTEVITPIYLVLNVPLALQGMVLAIWLIVKGFNPSTFVPETAKLLLMK